MKPNAILAVLFALCLSLGVGAQDGSRQVGSDPDTELMMVRTYQTSGMGPFEIRIINADGTMDQSKTKRESCDRDVVVILNRLYSEGWQLATSYGADVWSVHILTRKRQ